MGFKTQSENKTDHEWNPTKHYNKNLLYPKRGNKNFKPKWFLPLYTLGFTMITFQIWLLIWKLEVGEKITQKNIAPTSSIFRL